MQYNSASAEMSFGDDDLEYELPETPKRKSTAGRKLMRWDAGEDQLVLLSVDYVVSRDGVSLDWNEVAKVVQPNGSLTGDAIKQHLSKLRTQREARDLPNPPKLERAQIIKGKKQQQISTPLSTKKASGCQKVDAKDLGSSPSTPKRRVSTGLLYQKLKPESKSSSMKSQDRNTMATPTKKRRNDANQDIGKRNQLSVTTGDDLVNSFKMNQVAISHNGEASVTPKKNRRAGIGTNFPEGNLTSSPLENPFIRAEAPRMNLRTQESVDYTEPQVAEEFTVPDSSSSDPTSSDPTSSDPASPFNYNQSMAMYYQQVLAGNTLVGNGQFGLQGGMQNQVQALSSDNFSGNTLVNHNPLSEQHLSMGIEDPGFGSSHLMPSDANPLSYDEAFYGGMQSGMALKVEEEGINQDYGGLRDSMPGVGLGGDTGVFQMDPFTPRDAPMKNSYFEEAFGGKKEFEFFGGRF